MTALQDNFTLGLSMFIVGLLATAVTAIYIIKMHRYWERQPDAYTDEADEDVVNQ